ncbi:MAG: RagB/SusD family nutrient uptake outer membrane protein [Prolixibacteraceae bacterium]|nr:RagB/SusD family nutrient uptake outer membrane protein [Prolixibacteraceae bacterium]HNZ70152.1 RagB/SusD family nutrient uptake outer membrane protein [Prolixibacteraceae bacterium]HOF56043.1 RagB/SusD family nutrient uptake outer membrane protein [Prolixibacteraceae bacterium]HPL45606.1 RagB/SusD family nutrient uptake outer membrane protein [Prolixibacteraceae bacterium]HPV19076.1 RagB/SusD family nutrient uptake outer membrane protein [Prolixibacteraceae bacterium]
MKISLIILLAGGILVMSSCKDDFLNQDPQTSLSSEQLFSSLDNVQPFLNGLYFKWRSTRVNRKGFFLMLGTDESQQGEYQVRTEADQGGLDKYDGFYSSENKPIAQLWNIRWPVVVQASEALYHLRALLESADSKDTAEIKSYIGQAAFYRAAVMFELATNWGGLPVPEVKGANITLSGRKPVAEIYRMIEDDFTTAIRFLGKTAPDPRIATQWAAKALMGKMYMSAPVESGFRDFQKARVLFQDIVTNGGFSLAARFSDLWDPLKSPGKEPIYTFYFNNVWPDTNEAQWYCGSRATSSVPTNAIGGYDLLLPTEYCRNDVSMGGLWEPGDLRKEESIRYNFVNGNIFPSVYAGFGEDQLLPHIKKYEDFRINGIQSFYESGKNMYYVRYADILLSLAECMNETGDTPGAVAVVNDKIRARAWGGSLPADKKWPASMSPDEFRQNILDERMRELCFEGWRRFDLLRTGQFVPLISARNRWAKASALIAEKHTRYPIPIVEINSNPNLSPSDQNYGY